jgi:hypothetical protein
MSGRPSILSTRRRIYAQLKRVNRALSRWDEYEAHVLLPSQPRRSIKPPPIPREALKSLQTMLTEELSPIEEMWSGETRLVVDTVE